MRTLIRSTEEMAIGGANIRVVTLRSLIELKKAAGRPKDLESIAELELFRSKEEED